MQEKAQKNAKTAMKELMKIVKSEKYTDVKRKACADVMGLCNMKNVNKEDSITNNTNNKNYIKMSNKDLDKEYDQLLGNRRRKKKDPPVTKAPIDDTVN